MMQTIPRRAALVIGILVIAGCGGRPPAAVTTPAVPATPAVVAVAPEPVAVALPEPVPAAPEESSLPTISLGGSAPSAAAKPLTGDAAKPSTTAANSAEQRKQVVAAMNGIQVVLGSWRGTTNKEVGDFKALEAPNWVWDFRTDRGQPALVMKSEKSQYVTSARLTYLTDRQVYQMVAMDKEGKSRTLEGQLTSPVEEFEGDDRRVHRKYKLQLTEIGDAKDALQLTLNQQDNNRYLFEVERKKGNRFMRVDTVGTQREGSSFALNDSDYKDKTCVISGGLGATQVRFNGKSYWVCCSGCKAAFDEEPARWVAEYEAKLKEKAQAQPGS